MTTRDSKGRFVARRTRRNPDGAGYIAGGVFHPIRSWAGYNPTRAGEGAKAPPAPKRRPKAGTPEERGAKARDLVAQRRERRGRREADARAAKERAERERQERERAARAPIRSTAARGTSRVAGAGPATEAQRRYLADLLARRGNRIVRIDDAARYLRLTGAQWARLSKVDASSFIDRLKG